MIFPDFSSSFLLLSGRALKINKAEHPRPVAEQEPGRRGRKRGGWTGRIWFG